MYWLYPADGHTDFVHPLPVSAACMSLLRYATHTGSDGHLPLVTMLAAKPFGYVTFGCRMGFG